MDDKIRIIKARKRFDPMGRNRKDRTAAIKAVAGRADAAVVEVLIAVATDPKDDPEVRLAAVQGLAQSSDPHPAKALAALLADAGQSELHRAAVSGLGEMGSVEALSALVAGYEHSDSETTQAISDALLSAAADSEKADQATAALLTGLNHASARVRDEAARTLGQVSGATTCLIGALDDERDLVRQGAARLLGEMGEPAVPDLVIALGAEDDHTREGAKLALNAIGPAAAGALISALGGDSDNVATAAVELLRMQGAQVAPAVVAALPQTPKARTLLVELGGEAVEPLVAALGESQDAMEILAEIGEPAAGPLTAALEDASTRAAAAQALAGMGKMPDIQGIEARFSELETARKEAIQSAQQRLKLAEYYENSSDPFHKVVWSSVFDHVMKVSFTGVQETLRRIFEQIAEQEPCSEAKLSLFYQLAYTWLQAVDSEPLLFRVPLGECLELTRDLLTFREQLCTLDPSFSDLTLYKPSLIPALLAEHGYVALQQHLQKRIQFFESHLEENPQDEKASSFLAELRDELAKPEEEFRQRYARFFYEHWLTPLRWKFPPAGELYADLILRLAPDFAGPDEDRTARVESAYFTMGHIYKEAELYEDAIRLFDKGLPRFPDDVRILSFMAECYMRQENRDREKAYSLLEQALQLQPEFNYARYLLALNMWLQGDMEEALPHFATLVGQQQIYAALLAELVADSQDLFMHKLTDLCAKGQVSEAFRLWSTVDDLLDNPVAQQDPGVFVNARKTLAASYPTLAQKRQTHETVERHLANAMKIVELDNREISALAVASGDAALYFLENGDHRTALQWAEQSVQLDRELAPGWYMCALCHLELGNYGAAIQCAEIAASLGFEPAMDLLRQLRA